ncbi:threonine-phosphate decarboxylase [Anaerocolumna chitinilytica]|uniref:Threonine-phosphate decarboxylase n=2 Tax=Anaerocolumna chitinilytica TaxID=1727145 RepID=A0A7I8DSD2_9FIRM|nr:threonine-phosphate decarboxylase [Anaerocolumna chitinilytica]
MQHGGDIYRNKIKLDFSVNINPYGMPDSVRLALLRAIGDCDKYPDIQSMDLINSISELTGVDGRFILPGNGASELFAAIVHGIQPRRIVIPVPSFYGYEKAAAMAESFKIINKETAIAAALEEPVETLGKRPAKAAMMAEPEVVFYEMKETAAFKLDEGIREYLTEETDLLFLANPNNPLGNLVEGGLLEQIAKDCKEKRICLVIDECFLDFTGEEEKYSFKRKLREYPEVIVVKAFTKIFAIPGVRLGFLLCSDENRKGKIQKHLPEWNLSVFAQAAGRAACQEIAYMKQTVKFVQEERDYLSEELRKMGIEVYPSQTDYLFIRTEIPLYEKLLEKEILIRDCSNFRGLGRGYYRIAVKTHEENKQLINAVKEIKKLEH